MSTFSLITLTRDSFIVDYDGIEYSVNGERGGDGTWDVFPQMVYQIVPDSRPRLVEDDALKAAIVAALFANWDQYGYDYTLNLIED